VDTFLAREAREIRFSKSHRQVVIGTLLGDGYLDRTTRGYALRIHHGIVQKEYVDYKYQLIKCFVNSAPKASGKAYYFRTVSHPELTDLRNNFYIKQKKILPKNLLEESFYALSFAIWIMDDGAADKNQLRINTQCFSLEEHIWLTNFLQAKLRIKSTINVDKG